MRLARAAVLVAFAAAVAAAGSRGASAEGADAWAWLASADPRPEAVRTAPGLTPEEQGAGIDAWRRHVVTIAVTGAGDAPADTAADAAGVVVDASGVVATSWRVVASAKNRGDARLWARPAAGAWLRAVPVGETWYADVALLRLVTPRRAFEPVTWGRVERSRVGKRLLAVGAALGKGNVIAAGTATGMTWFDPAAPAGRVELRRGALSHSLSRDALPILLHASDDLAAAGGLGSGVFALDGACVGIVSVPDPSRPDGEHVSVRASDGLLPFVERILADGTFAPPALGLRLGPPPAPPGVLVRTPVDVARARDAKERGGALVLAVDEGGPSTGRVWPGEVVLGLGARTVFADAPESIGLALLALVEDVPVDVVLWRGGKRTPVKVVPAPARGGRRDPQDDHDGQGAPLLSGAKSG